MVTNRRVADGDAGDNSEQTPHLVIPECQAWGRSGGADLARSNSSWARLAGVVRFEGGHPLADHRATRTMRLAWVCQLRCS